MGAAGYAKVLPALRALKARLLPPDRLREVAATSSVDDVVAALRESMYSQAAEYRVPERVAAAMYKVYWGVVERIARLAPERARGLAHLFTVVDEVDDALTLAYRAVRGEPSTAGLVTAAIEGTLAWRAVQEPEVASSLQRLAEAAPRRLRDVLALADRVYSETRDPYAVALARVPAKLALLDAALSRLEARGRPPTESILCPLARAEAVVALLEAAAAGVQPRLLEAAWARAPKVCGLRLRRLARAYAEEGDPQALVARLRQEIPQAALEGRDPLQAAASARTAARREARARAEAVYAGYPLHAGMVAAGLALARFEMEDLRAILLATKYRVHPSDYARVLSAPGVA